MAHCIKAAFEINIYHAVKVFPAHFHKQVISSNPGIIHQNINVAVFFRQLLYHDSTGFKISHITAVQGAFSPCPADILKRFLRLIPGAVIIYYDKSAFSGKR